MRLRFLVAAVAIAAPALGAPARTFASLTTGNGFGFAVYDATAQKVTTFLEHPYRYLRPQADPRGDGVGRRNLIYDFYFGLKTAGGAGWLATAAAAGDPLYESDTNVIHARQSLDGVTADSYFFEPFGYDGNALVAVVHAPGAQQAYALFNFHMGSTTTSDTMPGTDGEHVRASSVPGAVVETGNGTGAMVYVPLTGVDVADCAGVFTKVSSGAGLSEDTSCAMDDTVPGFQKALGSDGWWAVAMQYVDDPSQADAVAQALVAWAGGRTGDKIVSDTIAAFEAWRKPPPSGVILSDAERAVWRQSETVLRMGQVREPDVAGRVNHGMMLAALPPGEWHTGWVRDGSYATAALARMGHTAEAKDALSFFLNAAPVGAFKSYVKNVPYQISVCRYYGDGQEQADYSGQPSPNVEIDGWGLVMWAARSYVEASGDTAWLSSTVASGKTVYQVLHDGVAEPLATNLEPSGIADADSSIWEVHDDNKKHFAYTTMAAVRGFCDMSALAAKAGNAPDASRYATLSSKALGALRSPGVLFVDSNGAIAGSLEGLTSGTYTDASVVEVFPWHLVDPQGLVATATLARLGMLRVQSGGYKRNDYNQSSYDDNEWIFVDLRLSDALRRAGRTSDADALLAQVVGPAAANFDLVPELFNAIPGDGPIGAFAGAVPMVGYGAGAYVMTILDRAGLEAPTDCQAATTSDDGGVTPAGTRAEGCSCSLGARGASPTGEALVALAFATALALARRRRRRARA